MPVLMGDEGSILGRIGMSTLAKPALRSKQEITHAHGKTFPTAGFQPAAFVDRLLGGLAFADRRYRLNRAFQ